ncbi:ATP-binding protein [Pseudomonas juntendi]|uniref:AAA family ATPase n=1 Tax=Pseudomonas putida TaxID=303 RepID=A0A1X0ZPA8_PSEPU|nr:ATP-binding protein [Pseudomonas putida]ORL60097.1 AAA family ATPase [Pseudomonas putida]
MTSSLATSTELTLEAVAQLKRIADSLERAFPPATGPAFDAGAIAYQWQYRASQGRMRAQLVPVRRPTLIAFEQLQNVDRQKALIRQNTQQFLDGKPANNVLLTGARGTGKSSLVKACLNEFHARGLKLVEIDKEHIGDLPEVIELVSQQPGYFILFCDDLSFEEGDIGYKRLKTALDGSVAEHSSNVLIYATSNRRHLIAERASDNLSMTRGENGALHPGEEVEEKVSLSERFGLWISFYGFSPDEYLNAVDQWLGAYGVPEHALEQAHLQATRWATQRGSRSGRIAAQFARDYAGRWNQETV